jgi:septum formation protein
VECHGHVLGKPVDRDDARRMLLMLRSRVHHVYSGVCLWRRPDDEMLTRVDVTKLRMDHRSDRELDSYLATDEWQGKAGAFGYQDQHDWLHVIRGSESNVVGLPMELLAAMLDELARRQLRPD